MTWFSVSDFHRKNRGKENKQTEGILSLKEMLCSILKMEGTTNPGNFLGPLSKIHIVLK